MIQLVLCILVLSALVTVFAETTRDYCNLPDTVYADGVTAATFGTSGWNYQNSASWDNFVVTCGGSHQSPINIITTNVSSESIQPKINYLNKAENQSYEEVNITYTKEYEGEYSELTVTDASNSVYKYYAKQFHVHTPSEHTIDGVQFDLEIHFVHYAVQDSEQDCNVVKNKITVFGIMFKETSNATDFNVFNTWFDSNVTGEVESFDLSDFFSLMTDFTYYHYNGSLTTLPCTQTVNWIVFYEPVPISSSQLTKFQNAFSDTTVFKGNNRPLQHVNDRTIVKGVALLSGVTTIPTVEASYTFMLSFLITLQFIL